MPSGLGLHWKKLDADFTISGLLNGMFGIQAWMNELYERWRATAANSNRDRLYSRIPNEMLDRLKG